MKYLLGSVLIGVLLLAHYGYAASTDKFQSIDAIAKAFFAESRPPGLAITVAYQDKIIWSKGYGYADLEQKVKIDPGQSKFRTGSVAKPFTSFALMQLYEEGKIDLSADVRRYVKSFPKKKYPFTVRQLAAHFSGIRHYRKGEAYRREHYSRLSDAITIFAEDPLLIEPETEWRYSSYGYVLLGVVIEQASGMAFDDYLQQKVFMPFGMKNTVADKLSILIDNRVRYYGKNINGGKNIGNFFNEKEVDNYYKLPAGGYVGTTEDMAKFGLAVLSGRYLKGETRAKMWEEQKTKSGKKTEYSLGWRVVTDEQGIRWIGHGGGSIGGTTQFWLFPDHGLVLTSASNQTELNYGRLMLDLRNWFFDHLNLTRS